MVKAVLCDIEGTTSSISFVHETLFPYAKKQMRDFLETHRDKPGVAHEIGQIIDKNENVLTLDDVIDKLLEWIAQDKKETSLKTLQGMIWKEGFTRGDFRGHLYPDVLSAFQRWKSAGLDLYIYSSGSLQAQKLYFQYSNKGDLSNLLSGYFDTTTGPKREKASYEKIALAIGVSPPSVLFLSDIAEELEAAESAQMQVVRLVRPQDTKPGSRFSEVADFTQIHPEEL